MAEDDVPGILYLLYSVFDLPTTSIPWAEAEDLFLLFSGARLCNVSVMFPSFHLLCCGHRTDVACTISQKHALDYDETRLLVCLNTPVLAYLSGGCIGTPIVNSADQCASCRNSFSLLRRKQVCRSCGKLFCRECCKQKVALPDIGLQKEVLVCESCYRTARLPSALDENPDDEGAEDLKFRPQTL